jgi:tRNA threonylcarbamoyl adenosine modification protein YeaZ
VLLLAFDTATPVITVAVADGARVLAEWNVLDARRHGELLAPGIARVLAEAGASPGDVARIAVGVGPGPFTSLRVGVVTARTLGAVLGVPVVGVCTHDAIALEAVELDPALADAPFLVATDARRREVYWARYDHSARVDGPGVARPADLRWTGSVVGYGATLYPEELGAARAPEHARAAAIATHVEAGGHTLDPVPLYLRRPDAMPLGPPKRVRS